MSKTKTTKARPPRKRIARAVEPLAAARSATNESAPSREELAALLAAAEELAERFAGDATILRLALEADRAPVRALAHAVTASRLRGALRVVEGIGAGREALRVYLVDLLEGVATLRRADGAATDKPSVFLRKTLALAEPFACIRDRLHVVAPELAARATDERLWPALSACEAAGPGVAGSAKWDALSDAWFALSGERISPSSMRVAQSAARGQRAVRGLVSGKR